MDLTGRSRFMSDGFCGGEVRSRGGKKETFATNCVFLSAEGCSEGIEGAGREERGKRGEAGRVGSEGGGEREKKALSQAIKLNIELHSSSCLSMPLRLMLPPKQRIKGLECGVGKSQALSLPACDICKSLRQTRESGREGAGECGRGERRREEEEKKNNRVSLHGMWLNGMCLMSDRAMTQSAVWLQRSPPSPPGPRFLRVVRFFLGFF